MKIERWAGGIAFLLVVGLGLAALGAGSIVAWEYSNSDAFCTNACHAVHPEEPRAHEVSAHARVQCVECHIGRVSTLKAMATKTTHTHELMGMIFGYERPLISTTLKPSRQACETCHLPAMAHDDTVRVKKHYDADARSTETTTRLTLHTGFGAIRDSEARGIHWHVENPVAYAALDPQKQKIPLVQVTYPDGRTDTFVDATVKTPVAELEQLPRKPMDCIDCHNAVGHPFPNPVDRVDAAIASSKLRQKVPDLKARVMAVVEEVIALDEKGEVSPEVLRERVADAANRYRRESGNTAPAADVGQFENVLTEILRQSVFAAPGVTWRSFPNNGAHKDFPGCFRCHDGKHLNAEGKAIPLQCNLCHAIPQVQREGGPAPVASTVVPGIPQPASHRDPNFMHDHRLHMDATCGGCHGKVEFGREGGSFCANPACHGRKWPEVNLNVTRG